MPQYHFIPNDDAGRAGWLSNFARQLGLMGANVGVSPTEIAQAQADSAFFDYLLQAQAYYTSTAKALTTAKRMAVKGEGMLSVSVVPLSPPPSAVPANIIGRNSALGARIKKFPGVDDATLKLLGLIAPEHKVDYTNMVPPLTVRIRDAGQPRIRWKKAGMEAVELWVDRGSGKFELLVFSTGFEYVDRAPLPPRDQSAIWKYKAIYRQGDQRVGEWSAVVSVVVRGV